MSRTGRYWVFFVIVAVGLALSWSQVGRKTHRVLQDQQIVYLHTEPDCRPGAAPCAATAADRALVVGPAARGLLARRTGFDAMSLQGAEVAMLATDGSELARYPLPLNVADWILADIPPAARMLRFRVDAGREATVAEFPLGKLR